MRCKVGDLAFIRQAKHKSNIGMVVQCESLIGKCEIGEKCTVDSHINVATVSDHYWVIVSKTKLKTDSGIISRGVIPDSWLIPINGEPSENFEEEIAEDLGKELVHIER